MLTPPPPNFVVFWIDPAPEGTTAVANAASLAGAAFFAGPAFASLAFAVGGSSDGSSAGLAPDVAPLSGGRTTPSRCFSRMRTFTPSSAAVSAATAPDDP